ncbi:methyltransferase domain-containing protein [Thalassobaculum sp.]|uniref:class I SAM-dependent methyltransferase n=1 Tax=Thalassobaculum sp. TaxID=2022740 RepID=UPI0032ECB6E5
MKTVIARARRVGQPMVSLLLAGWDRWVSSQSRMRHLPPRLARHLTDIDDVLDVGSGSGQLARLLMQINPALSITGVDVKLQPDPGIPVLRYDGVQLPFADNAFDAVTLVDVLHHDRQPERVLQEALRVARHRIVIKDHYWVTRWDHLQLCIADYLGNRPYGIALPYNFLKIEGWRDLFEKAGVRVTRVERFHYSMWDRVKQIIFVLEPATLRHGAAVDPPASPGVAFVEPHARRS